jgi:hypothetical protein
MRVRDDLLDESGVGDAPRAGAHVGRWWAWSGSLALTGLVLIAWAGVELSGSQLGTSLRPRGCDAGVLGAVVLLGVGALALLVAIGLVRLRQPGSVLAWDARSLAWTLPAPVALLAATIPGVAGCTVARDLAGLPVLGDALVGASGIALAGVAVTLVAAAIAATASVVVVVGDGSLEEQQPSIVELAIAAAEALESTRATERFRGVDPLD